MNGKMRSIGVVGGAGPMAGVALCERIVRMANIRYRCVRDCDYPRIVLISFPFSEMLSESADEQRIRTEIDGCLQELRSSGAVAMAIACNTLHAFLKGHQEGLVSILEVVEAAIPHGEPPLVLCTSASRERRVHASVFLCVYPNAAGQRRIDGWIEAILRGDRPSKELGAFIRDQDARVVILGCTELSLLSGRVETGGRLLIDPLDLLALELLNRFFINKE